MSFFQQDAAEKPWLETLAMCACVVLIVAVIVYLRTHSGIDDLWASLF